MKSQAVNTYLQSKPESVEDFPFGPQAAVFKIKHKIFAILGKHDGNEIVNLKCDPNEALMLRDIFDAVIPGYHMNKKHWNTVILNGTVPAKEIKRMIDRSYGLVVKSLKKSERTALELVHGTAALYD